MSDTTPEDDVIFETSERPEDGMSEEELEATESRVDAKVTKIKRELEQCKAEKQEYLDGWQRSKADYVNALKRFEEEKAGAVSRGVVKATHAFLPAIDSLTRAEAAGELPEAFQGIAKQLHGAAQSLGLERIGAVGDAFDPNHHEALGQDPAEGPEHDDTITAVLEPGWKMGSSTSLGTSEHVIRPAKVRVAQYLLPSDS